jgi:hypothetical protein
VDKCSPVDKYSTDDKCSISSKKSVQPSTTTSQSLSVCLPNSAMSLIQSKPERSSSSSSLCVTHPQLDLLSNSLAEAQINLGSFDDDDDDDDDYEKEDVLDNDAVQGLDLSTSALSQTIDEPVITSRPGMAEVLHEETGKTLFFVNFNVQV